MSTSDSVIGAIRTFLRDPCDATADAVERATPPARTEKTSSGCTVIAFDPFRDTCMCLVGVWRDSGTVDTAPMPPKVAAEVFLQRQDLARAMDDFADDPDLQPALRVLSQGPYQGYLAEVHGPGGSGKSTIALNLLASFATGADLLWPFSPSYKEPCPALLIQGEDPVYVTAFRLVKMMGDTQQRALVAKHLTVVQSRGFWFDFSKRPWGVTSHFRAFEQLIYGCDFLFTVIDPLIAIVGCDENSNAEMSYALRQISNVAEESQSAIMLVHHSSKAGSQVTSQFSARGAGAGVDVCRWVANVRTFTDADAHRYELSIEESHRYLELQVVKDSFFALPGPLLYRRGDGGRLEYVDLAMERLGRIAVAIRDVLRQSEITLTANEIAARPAGTDVRAQVHATIAEKIKAPTLTAAIQHGIRAF